MSCVVTHKPHAMEEIYARWHGEFDRAVVRWCKDCGAVVVDRDIDGRTAPGDHMPMRFPVLARRAAQPPQQLGPEQKEQL